MSYQIDKERAYQLVFVSLGLIYVGVDLKLTEPGQQSAVVPVCRVGVEHRGQGQGASHHPQDGQDPGEAQAGAGHGHWQLNTEPGQPGEEAASKYITAHIDQTSGAL